MCATDPANHARCCYQSVRTAVRLINPRSPPQPSAVEVGLRSMGRRGSWDTRFATIVAEDARSFLHRASMARSRRRWRSRAPAQGRRSVYAYEFGLEGGFTARAVRGGSRDYDRIPDLRDADAANGDDCLTAMQASIVCGSQASVLAFGASGGVERWPFRSRSWHGATVIAAASGRPRHGSFADSTRRLRHRRASRFRATK
jgi:hypothetical protein